MNKKSYLIMISVFLFIIDCVLIGVLIDVLLKSFPSYVLILFIPVISYCAFYNYYFFKYYFNGVDKIEYSDNELILHFIKSTRKIKYDDIILIKKGFTLAEVLITLVIIGIIASMTIPSVINAQHDKEILARLKKSYSILSQTLMTSQAFNGSYTGWGLQDNSNNSSKHTYDNYISPYIKSMKRCINEAGCWTSERTKAFDGRTTATGAFDSGMGQNNVTFVLADGSIVSMDIYGNDAESVFGVTENLVYPTLTFAVDINGDKGPNKLGQDVFMFILTTNGLVPAGIDNSSANCFKGSTDTYAGYDCAAKVLKTNSKLKNLFLKKVLVILFLLIK